MRYELFLRRDAALELRHQQRLLERVTQHEHLTAELFPDQGEPVGVDLAVDTDRPEAAKQLCEVAFELAADLQLSVYDPQLGAVVMPADQQQIVDRIEQTSAFLEGVGLGPPGSVSTSVTRGKLWLYVVVAAAALLLLGRLLTAL